MTLTASLTHCMEAVKYSALLRKAPTTIEFAHPTHNSTHQTILLVKYIRNLLTPHPSTTYNHCIRYHLSITHFGEHSD